MQAIPTKGYGASGSVFNGLKLMEIERQAPKADEVHLNILYCGVCHSGLHQVRNDWHNTIYPGVPGHEIIGALMKSAAALPGSR